MCRRASLLVAAVLIGLVALAAVVAAVVAYRRRSRELRGIALTVSLINE